MFFARRGRRRIGVSAVVAGILLLGAAPHAHDIPADIIVRAFVRPEGQRLHVLVRVPLAAIRDINFPLRDPAFLDLPKLGDLPLQGAQTWIAGSLVIYEDDDRILEEPQVLSTRISLPSDRSFVSYEEAAAHLKGPELPSETQIVWNQALLDVWLDYPIRSDRSRLSLRAEFTRLGLRVATVLRFQPPDGPERAFEYLGDPGLVRLDPRWHQAAARFVRLGFEHILDGIDHLLFLLCLVLPFRRLRELVLIVTSFTVAHSITLIASAFDLAPGALWFPPLIETLIAMSIVYMALENIVGITNLRRRWVITFCFGLVHGFGFSFALKETLQFAGSHLLTSLLSFNVGVELGQLLVLVILIPVLNFAFRRVIAERIGIIIVSAIVAHTAWHWMIERGSTLRQYDWSGLKPDTPGNVVRWLMAAVLLAAAVWVFRQGRKPAPQASSPKPQA